MLPRNFDIFMENVTRKNHYVPGVGATGCSKVGAETAPRSADGVGAWGARTTV